MTKEARYADPSSFAVLMFVIHSSPPTPALSFASNVSDHSPLNASLWLLPLLGFTFPSFVHLVHSTPPWGLCKKHHIQWSWPPFTKLQPLYGHSLYPFLYIFFCRWSVSICHTLYLFALARVPPPPTDPVGQKLPSYSWCLTPSSVSVIIPTP